MACSSLGQIFSQRAREIALANPADPGVHFRAMTQAL